MESFEEVELTWKGEGYTVAPDRVMGLVLTLENVLSQNGNQAMTVLLHPEGPPHGILAASYAAALRYAGAKVSDSEVYLSFQNALASGETEQVEMVQGATLGLIAIMSPPMGRILDIAADLPKGDAKKKSPKKGG